MKEAWKKKFFILPIFILLLTVRSNIVYAENSKVDQSTNNENTKIVLKEQKYTQAYENWLKLSDEEKEKVIMPSPYGTPFYTENKIKTGFQNNLFKAASKSDSKFDLRSLISIDVKDQQQTNSCWTFPCITALESNISLTRGYNSPLFSARHMEYGTSKVFLDNQINSMGYERQAGDGGNTYFGFSYYTSGIGPVLEKDMPFENNEDDINISEIQKPVGQRVESYVRFPTIQKEYSGSTITYKDSQGNPLTPEQVEQVNESIKEHIIKYGGVVAPSCSSRTDFFNNPSTISASAYFCNDPKVVADHVVTIIGWDDNYPKTNFNTEHQPNNDGAWLVQSSYGRTFSNHDGCYYISYEDALINLENAGIVLVTDRDYTNIYQYDILSAWRAYYFATTSDGSNYTPINQLYAANVFTAKATEYIKDIAITGAGENYVDVYIKKSEDKTIDGATQVASHVLLKNEYHTFHLKDLIQVTSGEKFSVIVVYTGVNPEIGASFGVEEPQIGKEFGTATANAGESFYSFDGQEWTDITQGSEVYSKIDNANISIKAFSTTNDKTPPQIEFKTDGNSTWKRDQGSIIQVTAVNGINESTFRYVWRQSSVRPQEMSGFKNSFINNEDVRDKTDSGNNWHIWAVAKDMLGNVVYKKSGDFWLDNIPPTAPNISGNVTNDQWTNLDVKLTINGSTNLSGIQKYRYTLDNGSSYTDVPSGGVQFSQSGTYIVRAIAIGNTGLESPISTAFVVKIDKMPPNVENVEENGTYKRAQPKITDDNGVKATLKKDGGEEKPYNIDDSTHLGDEITEPGDYTLKVEDNLGNVKEVHFTIDSGVPTAPTINSNAPDNKFFGQDAWASFSGSQSENGIKNYQFSVDNKQTWTDIGENEKTPFTEDGIYVIYARAVDNNGVAGDIAGPYTIKIDKTPPVVKNVEDGKSYQSATPEVEDASDVKVELWKDGEKVEDYEPGDKIEDEGDYRLKAEDEAGNVTEIEFTIDKTGPEIIFNPEGNTTWAKSQSTVVTIRDARSQIDPNNVKYKWTQSIQVLTESTFLPNSTPFANGDKITKNTESGDNWYLWVYAKDMAGNLSLVKSKAFYLDNEIPTAPTLTPSTPNGGISEEQVKIGISGSTSPSGIAKYQYTKDNGNTWIDIKVGGTLIINQNGTYRIKVRAVNNVGTPGYETEEYQVTVNKQGVLVTFTPNENPKYSKTQSTKIDVSSTKGNITNIKYIWSQESDNITEAEVINAFQNHTTVTKNTDSGIWYVWVLGEDDAGNKELVRSGVFYLDNDNPIIKGVENGKVYTSKVTIEITDATSSVTAKIKKDGQEFTGTSITQDGVYQIIATDEAGNTASVTFTLNAGNNNNNNNNNNDDNKGPIVHFTPNENKVYSLEQRTKVDVEDSTGVNDNSLKYIWSKDPNNKPDKKDFSKSFKNGSVVINNTDTGKLYLWVYAEDKQGNATIARSGVFYLDNRRPTKPTIDGNVKDGGITDGDVDLDIGGSEAESEVHYEYSIDGGKTWNDLDDNHLHFDRKGTVKVLVKAVGETGLESEIAEYTFTIIDKNGSQSINPIPQTGNSTLFLIIVALIGVSIYSFYKMKSIK